MKAMLHEVTGRNGYCGPTAISTILGISTDHAAALARERNGLRVVKRLPTYMLAGVLRDAGCKVRHHAVPGNPTMAAWLAEMKLSPDRHYVVVFRNHFGVILGREYLCSQTGRQRVRHADIPGRRGRVVEYLAIDELPTNPPADPRVANPRKASTQKARLEAKRLAAEHSIEIERHSKDGGWNVWPPTAVQEDPHEGDHYAADWEEVLAMVKDYAQILAGATQAQKHPSHSSREAITS